jgi:uncharacterized protein (DUF1800 family)
MNRRSFLQSLRPRDGQAIQSGLSPYTGTWGNTQIAHLLRRTTFGIRAGDIAQLQSLAMSATVDLLLTSPNATTIGTPINYYLDSDGGFGGVALGNTWHDAAITYENYEPARINSVRVWLMRRMWAQELTVFDKMAFFWHNHFALEANEIYSAKRNYRYCLTLNQYALGNFKQLVRAITLDPAMLDYLNGRYNNANAPDENYARELQELFTVGKGPDSHYTEADVQAAARVLTGYGYLNNPFDSNPFDEFSFGWSNYYGWTDYNLHDAGNKQFSAFYNNTVVQGISGAGGINELDALLNMIFAQQEAAKFICRKLYRFFVYYDITPQIETDIITPLADIFRNNNYEIIPVLSALFKSEHFYDSLNQACQIKNPLDFTMGLCRQFAIPFWTGVSTNFFIQNWQVSVANRDRCIEAFRQHCEQTAMSPLDPPSVSGWTAYYQEPLFYELLVNADTYAKHMELVHLLCNAGVLVSTPYSNPSSFLLKINFIAFAQSLSNPSNPNILIDDALIRLYAYPVAQAFKDYLKSFLLSGQTADYYWTNAWADYTANPNNVTYKTIVESRLRSMIEYMLSQAEYLLA